MHFLLVGDEMKMARALRRDLKQGFTRSTRSARTPTTDRVVDVNNYAGIAREVPTAPHDSYLIANGSHVVQRTANPLPRPLVTTSGSPPQVAPSAYAALGRDL